MRRVWQMLVNVALYGGLLWMAYQSVFVEGDPWFAFVVIFLLLLSLVISVTPSLRAPRASPGEYPYED